MNRHSVLTLGSRFIAVVALTASLPLHAGDPISQAPKAAVPAATTLNLMKLPLLFERSQTEADSEVQFTSRGQGYSLFLTPKEIVLVLANGSENSQSELARHGPRHRLGADEPEGRESSVVRMKMVGANARPRLTGREELPSKSHYFVGNDPSRWRTNVPNFAKVEYEEVYPGVDLVFYGNQRQLEFDFVLEPGVDPACVRISFEGIEELWVDEAGNLVLKLGQRRVTFLRPLVYQVINGEKKNVSSSYRIASCSKADGQDQERGAYGIGFELASYDVAKPLVIDPVLVFSTYFGGSGIDFGSSVAADSAGNAYLTGDTSSADFPKRGGLLISQSTNAPDFIVAKFGPTGALIYSTYLGGRGADTGPEVSSIAVDSAGSALITGATSSRNFPTANAFQPQHSAGTLGADAFVTKLSPDGSQLIYSTYLGGSPRIEVRPGTLNFGHVAVGGFKDLRVKVHNTTSVRVKGFVSISDPLFRVITAPNTFDLQPGAEAEWVIQYRPNSPSKDQAVFAVEITEPKLTSDSTGVQLYGNTDEVFPERANTVFFEGEDGGRGIAVDASGNAYVAGYSFSANFPIKNPVQPMLGGSFDAFVAKFDPAGGLVYSTLLGGLEVDAAYGIAVDAQGNAYVTGSTGGARSTNNFPVTPGVLQSANASTGEYFVSKLNAAGNGLAYSTFLQRHVPGRPEAIAVDAEGNAYLTGTGATNVFTTNITFHLPFNGSDDAFITKLNPTASALLFSGFVGGNDREDGKSIAVDASGNAYITGSTTSTNFPLRDPVQSSRRGTGDAFVAKVNTISKTLDFATYLGGDGFDGGYGIALDPFNNIYVAGLTLSPSNFPLVNAVQTNLAGTSDMFLAKLGTLPGAPCFQVWQKLQLPGTFVSTSTNDVKVQFRRLVGGVELVADAPILQVTSSNVTVRVPVNLLGPSDALPPPQGSDPNVTIKIITGLPQSPQTNELHNYSFCYPRDLLYNELFVPPVIPAGAAPQVPTMLRTLPQFRVNNPTNLNDPTTLATFVFLGQSTDGVVGLRTLNSSLAFPRPLRLQNGLTVFQPNLTGGGFSPVPVPFHIPNLSASDEGLQWDVSRNGLYVVVVEPATNSPGPFPAPFQIHLAGNVGLPRKLINGVPEYPRAVRQDTLFNHPAPRPQSLGGAPAGLAETALFKFVNLASISQFARAVLIPPPGGFALGAPIIRAADPAAPVDITTPTARTPDCAMPAPGTIIDFTQVPDPALPGVPGPSGTICAVIGAVDGAGFALPFTTATGVSVTNLIFDLGSGEEFVDGTGADFKIFALSGSYTVAVGNTPYAGTFVPISGTFARTNEFDLAGTSLTSARFVQVTAAPTVVLDAVQGLNIFADQVLTDIGAVTHVTSATITVRRAKSPMTPLDPFLQLIAPNGDLFGENESAFGDDLSLDLSDAALINRILPQDGFYRFLVKGYDQQPDAQAFGSFFARLETSGNYDPVELVVSSAGEEQTTAQKTGAISATRQRDSYLFQAQPGQGINIVVNATGNQPSLNPLFELYDPEDFLIAASDDFSGRGRNAAGSLMLPAVSAAGTNLPNPSTYRVVVSAIDGFGSVSPLSTGKAHIRQAASGNYELKVFTGALTGIPPGGTPRIDLINPASGSPGTQVTISGANFSGTATSNLVLFGSAPATVISASTTQLVVVVPAGLPAGPASVTVAVGGQTSAPASFQISAPVTRTAAARLNCLSLRFQPAIVRFGGQDYRLELTSLADTSPPNGELYPLFDPFDYSHAGSLLLRALNSPDTIGGAIFLNVPTTSDVDRDGVADFFQVSQGVGSTQTQGDYFTDIDGGTVTATWSRVAGSKTGTCRLVLLSVDLGQLPEFTNTFELLEYTGSLTYTPASNNLTGAVLFVQTQSSSNTLTGPIQLTRSPTNRLNELQYSSGRWTNAIGGTLGYNSGVLLRVSGSSSNYIGALQFDDGDLATTDADYYDWVLFVRDPNDVDGDGVPDLSDDPSDGLPPVAFTGVRLESGQIVLEWRGTGRLQSASEIGGPWDEIIGASSPFRQTPVGARRYFRIAP